ncbi:energy coupling factor transporter S component ThiW [Clostridium algidicarnis]|uniref:energy coupling factor transporter S component ThiW n=1 Tax=Clostridium algidicarnis TaxID=37659 RepID=UPI001C0C69F1|nr:energy coupling factor transporter S component ThiW [Clostridium algidicarnis]MBU3192742.1 energy coupling factor transporter S component ThiW [Clostridium algidicarnis]
MKTKKMTISAMLIAIGVLGSQIIYIPVGASKCFPVQHTINIIAAVILGPIYSLGIAFVISILRNILGVGSMLAFPGSMIGALLAGLLFRVTSKKEMAILGEIFGTGILGGIMAFPIAKFILGKDVAALFYVVPFLISTIGGSGIAYAILKILDLGKISKKIL